MGLGSRGDPFDAFLTKTIGSGETTLSEAADLTVSNGSFTTITPFSGLSLAANTDYYLTIAPKTDQDVEWVSTQPLTSSSFTFTQAPMTMDSRVSFLSPPSFGTKEGGNCNDPAPGSYPSSVTANTSGVPEPSTGIPAAAGLAAVGLRKLLKLRA